MPSVIPFHSIRCSFPAMMRTEIMKHGWIAYVQSVLGGPIIPSRRTSSGSIGSHLDGAPPNRSGRHRIDPTRMPDRLYMGCCRRTRNRRSHAATWGMVALDVTYEPSITRPMSAQDCKLVAQRGLNMLAVTTVATRTLLTPTRRSGPRLLERARSLSDPL